MRPPTRAGSTSAGLGLGLSAGILEGNDTSPTAAAGDSGFVVAADVISEKELKGCFVSQTMSLKLSSFF